MFEDGCHLLEVNGAVQWLGVHEASRATVPLVVLHGGPGASNWIYEQSVAAAIACQRTLVLHEQRGCGRATPARDTAYSIESLVADVQAVIDRLEVGQVDLLGWSFGADLAARVVLERPDRVRRLVLQAPALDFSADAVPEYLLSSHLELASPDVRDDVARVVHSPGRPWDSVDPRRTESIALAIPHARTVVFAASAHMPELEEPHAYAEALLDFLS